MNAIRYFRPDMLFALGPWHLERDGRAACGYRPPEGWQAQTKERHPWCPECMEILEQEREQDARQKS